MTEWFELVTKAQEKAPLLPHSYRSVFRDENMNLEVHFL